MQCECNNKSPMMLQYNIYGSDNVRGHVVLCTEGAKIEKNIKFNYFFNLNGRDYIFFRNKRSIYA